MLRFAGLAAAAAGGLLGGDIAFRLAGGANHAEQVPHLVQPGCHDLATWADLPEGHPVREMLGEVPLVVIRDGGRLHVLADRCSHFSGPLSEGSLEGGCLTCPWHGSVFRIADGSIVRDRPPRLSPCSTPASGTASSRSACQEPADQAR